MYVYLEASISVHEEGGRCVYVQQQRNSDILARVCLYMFRYTYADIRGMKMQMEKEVRHMGRVMRTSIGTVT